jgi:hypothetical protein
MQSFVTTIIRIKELISDSYEPPQWILDWPRFLQHGMNNQLQLDLVESGLTDRNAVLILEKVLLRRKYKHINYKTLREYLLANYKKLLPMGQRQAPKISQDKIVELFSFLAINAMR